MARILVTGATGLIGRAAVAALLEKDCEVIALSRREPLDLPGISPVICDVTDPVAVDQVLRNTQVETLLHLAWLTGAERWHGAENLDWVGHSLHLVRSFAEAGGRRVVGAGSCAEYDWTDGGVLSETSPLRPATAYGAAKAATGLALCGCAKALGLSLAWARIFFVFGPGEPRGRLFGDLIHGLSAGETVNCTDGRQKRDFLHVRDLGHALAGLTLAPDVTGPINIAHGTPIAVRDLILELADQLGATDRVELGARPRPASDPDLLAADVSLMRQSLDLPPMLSWPDAVAQVLFEDSRQGQKR